MSDLKLDKESWVKLAEAFVKDTNYLHDIQNFIQETGRKYDVPTDFLGLPYDYGALFIAVQNLLGEDFEYWYFDCDKSYEAFNRNTTHKDGRHPNVHDLNDLWYYSKYGLGGENGDD